MSSTPCFQPALAGILALALAAGCTSMGPAPVGSRDAYGPAPPGHYRIRRGDTLYAIADRRGLSYKTLARWNGIDPPYRIYAGRLLRVEPPSAGRSPTPVTPSAHGGTPGAAVAKTASPRPKVERSVSKPAQLNPSEPTVAGGKLRWRWPLEGRVTQSFRRGDRTRQGVRIVGRAGQKVVAAEGGVVVYSGSGLKGYGNLIIVKHNTDYLSAYGFNRRLLVKEGERVKRGQIVAEVGQVTGGEYLLHFEIRKDGTAVDPLAYLPGAR
jgi:lipoprotein NlpD